MPRPVTRIAHNNCGDCGMPMKEVTYIRPVAKLCDDCKTHNSYAHAQIKKIFRNFKKNPTKPAPDEMFFEDDPKALKEKEYGKVVKKQTAMGNQINILESNYHVL
jgi:hypothetical protein|tara:strand:+ start:239 stop:553 length:315 start_codon:yes stop_codon:yes gene_type:complete